MMKRFFILLATLMSSMICAAKADTFYVATIDALQTGASDGQRESPFSSVQAALTSGQVKGGDTLLLLSGRHGDLRLYNLAFTSPVTITSEVGRRAHFDSIYLMGNTSNLTFLKLSIWPTDLEKAPSSLFQTHPMTSNISAIGLRIKGDRHAEKFREWSASDWNRRKFNGIFMNGSGSIVKQNFLTGVYTGITLAGSDSMAIGNVVDGFNGDGLQALGENNQLIRNRVFNCVITDDNHDDGIQSWSTTGGRIGGLVIDGNVIIEWTDDSNHPLRCDLQGIGLFGGFYDNLRIVNNLVSTNQYHGISVYGARGAVISNNTVVNGRGYTALTPYIAVRDHKNGSPSMDVLVANNLAMSFSGSASLQDRVEFRNNSIIGTPGAVFQNPSSFDYRPKGTSGFIDTADTSLAPKRDMLNQRRPSGAAADRGSYETMVGSASASITAMVTQAEGGVEGEIASETGTTTTDTTAGKWIKIPGY